MTTRQTTITRRATERVTGQKFCHSGQHFVDAKLVTAIGGGRSICAACKKAKAKRMAEA